MSRFYPVVRQTGYLLRPSVDEWLPEDYLARFVVEVVEGLDISALEDVYVGRGGAADRFSVLLSLLVYGYANGVFLSRRVERVADDLVVFRFVVAGARADYVSLAGFCRRFFDELAGLLV